MSSRPPIAFLQDLPVEVVVELGRTQLTIRQLAELDRDDVVDLERAADEPLNLVVGGKILARGEVVMVGERMALRVTEVVSDSAERRAS
jgi:flagellar motor switch protein FliN/FliY